MTDPARAGSNAAGSKKSGNRPGRAATTAAVSPGAASTARPTDQATDRATDRATGAADAARVAGRLRFAAGICLLEALAALALAAVELASLDSKRLSAGVTTAVFFGLYAAGLAWSARGLARASSWSRGPIVLAQLIQLGVAWSFHGGLSTWITVALAVPAIIVLIVVFSPDTTTALYGQRAAGGGETDRTQT